MFAPILDSLCSALLAFSGTCFVFYCSVLPFGRLFNRCGYFDRRGIIRETLGGGGTGLDGSNGQEKLETTIGKP